MMEISRLSLIFLFFLHTLVELCTGFDGFANDSGPKACYLPTGNPALCVPLDQCLHITELLKNLQKPLPKNVGLLVGDSYFGCDSTSSEKTVCCPTSGIIPPTSLKPGIPKRDSCGLQDPSNEASCVLYSKCGPFIQLLLNLRRPFVKEIPDLMRNGWLCGVDTSTGGGLPKVCCPSAALPKEDKGNRELTKEPEEPELEKFKNHPNRKLLPNANSCGITPNGHQRIVGGQDAEIGQYPWLANLGFVSATSKEVSFKCGGALIGERWVLTAAHCVTNLPRGFQLARVRLGEHDLRKNPDCKPGGSSSEPDCSEIQEFDVDKIIHHEDYNTPNPFQNDIALLKLNVSAKINPYLSPVCLPFNDADDEDYVLGEDSPRLLTEVAGWGATNERGRAPADILQFLKVDVTDAEKCKEIYAERGGKLTPGLQMCAGGKKGLDSCVGDSGSSLMREEKGASDRYLWRIIGVVSFGPRLCGTEGIPGVYSRVQSYAQWILDNIEP